MKVAIMQPYFFPYIGYWQLMNAVDKYIIYDDVNYINRGWINRNRILAGNEVKYFNLPMLGASQNKLIKDIAVDNNKRLIEKNIRTLEFAYKKAPYYAQTAPLFQKIFWCGKDNLASYIMYSFEVICEYLGIETEMVLSSTLNKDNALKGQDKILQICKILGADEYFNAIGGQKLYSHEIFVREGIELRFLETLPIKYKQFSDVFQENLSIIDVMMFNSKEQIASMLNKYRLFCE